MAADPARAVFVAAVFQRGSSALDHQVARRTAARRGTATGREAELAEHRSPVRGTRTRSLRATHRQRLGRRAAVDQLNDTDPACELRDRAAEVESTRIGVVRWTPRRG